MQNMQNNNTMMSVKWRNCYIFRETQEILDGVYFLLKKNTSEC